MPRAFAGRLPPLTFAALMALLGMIALASAASAGDDGVPIGVFDAGEANGGDARTGDAEAETAVESDDSREGSSDDLYYAAIRSLQSGRFDAAQRQFEIFVAQTPRSALAANARRHLIELYNRPDGTTRGVLVDASADPGPSKTQAPPIPAPAATPLRAALRMPVATALEDSFITEAGDRIFFAPGSAELGVRARAVIAAQARWLKRHSELQTVIEGHADDAPLTAAQHERLSAARAEAVAGRLIEEGIARERIRIAPWGRDKPVATCSGSDCAAQNRRVVTVLTPRQVAGSRGAGIPYASGVTAPAR